MEYEQRQEDNWYYGGPHPRYDEYAEDDALHMYGIDDDARGQNYDDFDDARGQNGNDLDDSSSDYDDSDPYYDLYENENYQDRRPQRFICDCFACQPFDLDEVRSQILAIQDELSAMGYQWFVDMKYGVYCYQPEEPSAPLDYAEELALSYDEGLDKRLEVSVY